MTSNCSGSTNQTAKFTTRKKSNKLSFPCHNIPCSKALKTKQIQLCLSPPKKGGCLEVKIISEQQDQAGHAHTPSPPPFLLLAIISQFLFLIYGTSPPNQQIRAPITPSGRQQTSLVFRTDLLKLSLTPPALESIQYLVCTNCVHKH